MKLSYHKGKNVGDAINPIIFTHFLGADFFDASKDINLLGIGSILGLKAGLPGKKIVFSSGWGGGDVATYGNLPVINEDWDFRAVRGPLTAVALDLPKTVAVIDGAYLIVEIWPRSIEPKPGRVGFIPHHKSLDFFAGWDQVCQDAGMYFLDVRLDPRDFMEKLWSCESVVTEAMHGAIFADAYGIPWVPLRLYGHINEFKWKDWWASLGIEANIHRCPAKLHSSGFLAEVILRRGWPAFMASPASQIVLTRRRAAVVRWLRSLRSACCTLSDRRLVSELTGELRLRLDHILKDYMLPTGHDD